MFNSIDASQYHVILHSCTASQLEHFTMRSPHLRRPWRDTRIHIASSGCHSELAPSTTAQTCPFLTPYRRGSANRPRILSRKHLFNQSPGTVRLLQLGNKSFGSLRRTNHGASPPPPPSSHLTRMSCRAACSLLPGVALNCRAITRSERFRRTPQGGEVSLLCKYLRW